MTGSKPIPDTAQIETRLLVVAEMLERAVAEVQRAVAEIKSGDTASSPDMQKPAPEATEEMRGKDGHQ